MISRSSSKTTWKAGRFLHPTPGALVPRQHGAALGCWQRPCGGGREAEGRRGGGCCQKRWPWPRWFWQKWWEFGTAADFSLLMLGILGMLGMLSLTCSLSFPFCLVKSAVVKLRISWIYPNQHLPFSVPAPKREGETPYDLAKKGNHQTVMDLLKPVPWQPWSVKIDGWTGCRWTT